MGLRHPLRFRAVILLGKSAVSMRGIDFALLRKRRTARLSLVGKVAKQIGYIIERSTFGCFIGEYGMFE